MAIVGVELETLVSEPDALNTFFIAESLAKMLCNFFCLSNCSVA